MTGAALTLERRQLQLVLQRVRWAIPELCATTLVSEWQVRHSESLRVSWRPIGLSQNAVAV